MLKVASPASGVRYGCAVGEHVWADKQCMQLIHDNCRIVVNENAFKWGEMEQQKGEINWKYMDELMEFAEMHGDCLVKLHNLFWHQQQPKWLAEIKSAEELEREMKRRIEYTAEKFRGKAYLLYGIDVVNEAVDDQTGSLRDSLYARLLGADWVLKAYQWTREAFGSQVHLIYNDYNMEFNGLKDSGVYALVKELKARALVDEVGFQMHTVGDGKLDYETLFFVFRKYAELGVKLNISELDIRMNKGQKVSQSTLNKQGECASEIIRALLDTNFARSIVTWGITDKYTWIRPPHFKEDIPLPFDVNYNAKPFKKALERALTEYHAISFTGNQSFEAVLKTSGTLPPQPNDEIADTVCTYMFFGESQGVAVERKQYACAIL